MKHISKYIMMGALALAATGCDLDMEPETKMSDTGFWNSESDLRGACNRFYEQLNGNNDLGGGFSHDRRSDELVGTNDISKGSWTIPTENGAWTDSYWRINIANNILEKSKKAAVTEAILNRYQAEARFFRAYYYFELTKKYGDVPLLLRTINNTSDPALKMGRTPRAEVIEQVYQDLEFAAQWLPDIDKITAKNWGQVSKQAALAMIVRVGLYTGTHGKYHNDPNCDPNSHLDKAIAAASNLIKGENKGKFDLYYNFEELFQAKAEGRGNRENIFVKVYGPNGSASTGHRNSRDLENSVALSRNIVDLFLYTDGLPREKSPLAITPETSYDDIFSNRDPRLGMTIYKIDETAYKGPFNPFGFSTGYSIKKGFDLDQWTTNGNEWTDKMIIRYAEVLISYAEALYERNGSISDDDLNLTVNALRTRAGMPAMLTNAFVSAHGLNMLDEIRRERTVEFVDENKRYDDIIRWKIAEKVLPVDIIGAKFVDSETPKQRGDYDGHLTGAAGSLNGKARYDQEDMYVIEFAEDRKFNPKKDYLYPVPLFEISNSGGSVTPNPGWDE